MTIESIQALGNRLSEREAAPPQEPPKKMTRSERRKLQREVKKRAISLHSRIGQLKEILDKNFEGFLNLGKDPEQIRWDLMPEKIAACFQPEFKLQPEDIDRFGLSISELSGSDTRQISLKLYRKGLWWSFANLVVIARERDYYGGSCSVNCSASHGQQKEAREAAVTLREFIWRGEPADREEGPLKNNTRSLDLSDALLGFMVGEMERQTEQVSK